MSQSVIRKNNRTKSINYNDDDNQNYDYSIYNKVKYLTPTKYRVSQRAKLINVFPKMNNNDDTITNKNEYILTPTKYRLTKIYPSSPKYYNNNKPIQENIQESRQNIPRNNIKPFYKKYPIIIGDFILTEKPTDDKSIYNYKPKNTKMPSYVYKGTISSSEVKQRAMTDITQLVQQRSRAPSPNLNQNKPSYSNIKYQNPLYTSNNNYQPMLNSSSHNFQSITDDDLIINNSKDSVYENLRRQSYSLSSLYPLPSTVDENKHFNFSSNSHKIPLKQNSVYYFGKGSSEDILSNNEENSSSEDEYCFVLGRQSKPNPIIYTPRMQHVTRVPSFYNKPIEVIQVVDIGTSTDNNIIPDEEPLYTRKNDLISYNQGRSLNNQQSIISFQSERNESETYRINQETTDYENYEESDSVPSPAVIYPESISTNNSTRFPPYLNVKKSDNYGFDNTEAGPPSTEFSPYKPDENRYDEESQVSIPEIRPGLRRLARKNSLEPPTEFSPYKPDENQNYEESPVSISEIRPELRRLARKNSLEPPTEFSPYKPDENQYDEESQVSIPEIRPGLRRLARKNPLEPPTEFSPDKTDENQNYEESPVSISESRPGLRRLARKNPLEPPTEFSPDKTDENHNYEESPVSISESRPGLRRLARKNPIEPPTEFPSDKTDQNQNDEESQVSISEIQPGLRRLARKNPIEPSTTFHVNDNNDQKTEPSLSNKSIKTNRSLKSAKASTVITKTPEGAHERLPPRPSSTPPTDLEEELAGGRPPFGGRRPFPPTPFHGNLRPDKDDEDLDSDQMHRNEERIRQQQNELKRIKLIDESTQSEQKTTRNVGTMHEPIQTRNFGNEVQPQSSSTQTSTLFPIKPKPSRTFFTYIERPEEPQTSFDEPYSDPRISRREHDYYNTCDRKPCDRLKPRSPSPQTTVYVYDGQHPRYETQYEDHHYAEIRRRQSPPPPPHHQRISSPISYRPTTTIIRDRSRTPSPQRRSHTPTPPRRPQYPSPIRRPHSATPRHRPQMFSQETDTSLDAMRHRRNAGVQYEPRSTREIGTTPSVRIKPQIKNHRLTTHDKSRYSPQKCPTSYPSFSKHYDDHLEKNYYIKPTTNGDYYRDHYPPEEEEEEEEEKTPSMHDQSTMADLIVSFDHYTQCESQPFMADRFVQTTPVFDEDEYPEELVRELPRGGSISIPQPVIIQPDSLPRVRRPPTRPKRDGLDYTGNNLEISLHHGQQQRATSIRNSPILNIGSENYISQSSTNEYTIPFQTRYINGSDRSSTIRSRKNSIIIPVLHSPRTNLYTNHPIHQSQSNGNFYLSTGPSRSVNSSFRVDITANES